MAGTMLAPPALGQIAAAPIGLPGRTAAGKMARATVGEVQGDPDEAGQDDLASCCGSTCPTNWARHLSVAASTCPIFQACGVPVGLALEDALRIVFVRFAPRPATVSTSSSAPSGCSSGCAALLARADIGAAMMPPRRSSARLAHRGLCRHRRTPARLVHHQRRRALAVSATGSPTRCAASASPVHARIDTSNFIVGTSTPRRSSVTARTGAEAARRQRLPGGIKSRTWQGTARRPGLRK